MSTASSIQTPPPTAGRRRKPLLVKPANLEGMEEEERYKPIEWPLVRRLLRTLAPFKMQYLLGLALGLVHVSCDMASPTFMRHVIDYGTNFIAKKLPVMPTQSSAIAHVTWVILFW